MAEVTIIAILVIAASVLVFIAIQSSIISNKANGGIPASQVSNESYFSATYTPPIICGGVATQGWYLYSQMHNGDYLNKTIGQCGIISAPQCLFQSGYYGC